MTVLDVPRIPRLTSRESAFPVTAADEGIVRFNQQRIYYSKSSRGYGFSYFARTTIAAGRVAFKASGRLIDHQTAQYSIQIAANQHCLPINWTGRYLNHSCEPNTYVRTRSDGFPDFIAERDIGEDEEITYAYWCTEYAWISAADVVRVRCRCGSPKCRGKILSFSQLTPDEQTRLYRNGRCSRYLMK